MKPVFCKPEALCEEISHMIRDSKKRPYVIAIDGRAASGKSTLAEYLSEAFGAAVFHIDDYFLRPEQRTPERFAQAGGNFDRERFISEIVTPLERGENIVYRKFSCDTMSLCEAQEVVPTSVVIIEGVYSMHPEITRRGLYDLKIFADVTRKEQIRRIKERNGEKKLECFVNTWIPMEEEHFLAGNIADSCDFIYIANVRGERAKQYFLKGYNCAQSVLLAFSDVLEIDGELLAKLASPFGGGIGRLREVCGSVSGMLMAEGLLCGYCSPSDGEGKKRVYAETRSLADKFKEENGSMICRELLEGVQKTDGGSPEERTAEYYKKRPCAELVKCAAEILEEHLREQGIL